MSKHLLSVDTCIITRLSKETILKAFEYKYIGYHIRKTLKENFKN